MDDTRHVASWIGGQEALHDRVLTLDEALAAVDAVDAPAVQRLAGQLFHDDALRLAAVAPGPLSARPRAAPAAAGMTDRWPCPNAPNPPAAGRSSWSWPTPTSASASLALARVELETLAGLGRSRHDRPGRPRRGALADRRPARGGRGGGGRAGERQRRPDRARHRRRGGVIAGPAERGAPARDAGDHPARRARSTRSSPGCPGPASGRPMPTSPPRRHRPCSIAARRSRACRTRASRRRHRPRPRHAAAKGPATPVNLGFWDARGRRRPARSPRSSIRRTSSSWAGPR